MAGNYTALQTIWATLPATMLTGDKLAFVNQQMTAGPAVDVPRSEVRKVLQASGALDILQAYAANPPAGATDAVKASVNYILAVVGYEATYSDTLETSNSTYSSAIQSMVPNLITAGISQDTISAMMALIEPLIPWWQANGFAARVNIWDLISAGNLY
ncbi:hypothetical protein [Bradyrhizobium sp. Tv2a-2]|uniref:hypothetical protein n=1 Tax=Bradyrhizobium sp. Tv2a-2 TaxID=113395 RepID=UPI000427D53E|nr:hypothetical protein [Bradyrhizobium sp. Tv2a-2]